MYNNYYILQLVLILYLSPFIVAQQNAAISIFPENIYPGDVFVITVDSINTPTACLYNNINLEGLELLY